MVVHIFSPFLDFLKRPVSNLSWELSIPRIPIRKKEPDWITQSKVSFAAQGFAFALTKTLC